MSGSSASRETPSPRYWLLWPGVLLMIVVSFTELALQWRVFVYVSKAVWRGCCSSLNAAMRAAGKPSAYLEKQGHQKEETLVEDPAADHELVKVWMWLPLLSSSLSAPALSWAYNTTCLLV